MATPISSHMKDKNSIFTAGDEDMIFLVKGKILVFHQYLYNKLEFQIKLSHNILTIIYTTLLEPARVYVMIAVKPINILFIIRLINRKTLFFNFYFIYNSNRPNISFGLTACMVTIYPTWMECTICRAKHPRNPHITR